MDITERSNRLDRPVDHRVDHVLGLEDAEITLVEYGGYDCSSCRAANEYDELNRGLFTISRKVPPSGNVDGERDLAVFVRLRGKIPNTPRGNLAGLSNSEKPV